MSNVPMPHEHGRIIRIIANIHCSYSEATLFLRLCTNQLLNP